MFNDTYNNKKDEIYIMMRGLVMSVSYGSSWQTIYIGKNSYTVYRIGTRDTVTPIEGHALKIITEKFITKYMNSI